MPFDFKAWLREGEEDNTPYDLHPEYEKLPECIKCGVSAKEYSWLTDSQRNRLIEQECYPEIEDD